MGPVFPGFAVGDVISRSSRSRVYRGVREADGRPVVLKTPTVFPPDPEDLARLEREAAMLASLAIPGVPAAYGLVAGQKAVALVLEDCDAAPLASTLVAGVPMALGPFLALAIGVARLLGPLHQQLIHRDIHPGNLLWNPETETVRLIDFALATDVTPGAGSLPGPKRLVGALAFMSPEQTGRMDRAVDSRSDLYSLGITFYLLLTGRLPFEADEPMAWIYCHCAQAPVPPTTLVAALPAPIEAIVLKLMAKNPEDRYQSAHGLLRDLVACQARWQATGAIAPFALATADASAVFRLPERLYGREGDVRQVLEAFERASAGQPGLVMVAGAAGSGKSVLVREVARAIAAGQGLFLSGKFDQYQRHMPYAALSQALDGWTRHVMAEPESQVLAWRERLTEALGPNARIAVDRVPGLAGLMGEPPPAVALNPTEEQNRVLATLRALIAAIARPDHPLAIFLDDLQWSDAPTLALIRSLLEPPADGGALLVIGAYRDDEVGPGHPLALLLAEGDARWPLVRLALGPLDEPTVNQWVADVLHGEPARTRPLGAIVHARSEGNPLFAGELLRTLYQDGLVAYDPDAGRWEWDLAGVAGARIGDNVVELMVGRIQRLPSETQTQLRQAACIGNRFELSLLARLADQAVPAASLALAPALAAGLVAPAGERYQFLHDRVRQAAYASIVPNEREALHLQLGRLLLAHSNEAERESRAPEIAHQLNCGRGAIADPQERLELARLDLLAARKSKEAAAYRLAFEFTGIARELLPLDAWEAHYDLAFDVLRLHASCAALCGELGLAEAGYVELLARVRTPFERAEVQASKATQSTYANRMDEAIQEGLRALALLGIQLEARPPMATVAVALARVKWALGRRSAADLDDAPGSNDRTVGLAMKVLGDFLAPAYLGGHDTLFATTVLMQTRLSLRHGNRVESASAYASYAVLLAGLGDWGGADAFGRLALRLTERLGAIDTKCRTLVLYALFAHSWNRPWGELDGWFKAALEAALPAGDFLFMAYAAGYVHLWDPQVDLATASREGRRYLAIARQTGYQNAIEAASLAQQLRLNWLGETASPLSLDDANFDEAACLRRMREANYVSGVAIYHLYKLQIACFNAEWAMAWRELLAADRAIKALAGSPYLVEYCVYGFWAAARMASSPGPERAAAMCRVRKFRRQMHGWARHCPANFGFHARLMDAEVARLAGRWGEAPRLYQAAVEAARDGGFVRYEAQANERAARFYDERGLGPAADGYWRDARAAYGRWGATAKLRQIDRERPGLGRTAAAAASQPLAPQDARQFSLGLVPQLVESGVLDLATVWKATQALSSEPTFERLLERLMAIVKEHAGAQTGVLVLKEGDDAPPRFVVQAESLESGSRFLQAEPLEAYTGLPLGPVRYAIRSQSSVVLGNPAAEGAFVRDPYIVERRPRSLLVLPIVGQGQLLGVLYLENNLLGHAFTPERLAVLQILAGQAAVSLNNVRAAERSAYMEAEQAVKDSYARMLEDSVRARTAELEAANAQLMVLDRLKTNFLNVVSHELRTPLTSIIGFTELLEDELVGGPGSDGHEFLNQLRLGSKRLRRLVDDLLDFARIEAGTFRVEVQAGDLRAVFAQALDSLRPQLERAGLTLRFDRPEAPVWASFDGPRIEQVLLNLIGNAIKFTPPGGHIALAIAPAADAIRVTVTDTGTGIAPDHMAKLFDKFYQVDSSLTRPQGGAGLGLSIARSIVEAHGGTIGVTSALGEGSQFWFELPRQSATAGPEARTPGP